MQQTEILLAYRVPDPGYLRIEGADQADFIQRQTTNDIRRLGLGRSLLTVLPSATARILDVWQLVPEPDAIGVVTLPARGGSTARYLQSRIFFMDKVTLADVSSQIAQFRIGGEASIPGLSAMPAAGEITLTHLMMAMCVVTSLPCIILFFAAQRVFVQGIVMSGIKG